MGCSIIALVMVLAPISLCAASIYQLDPVEASSVREAIPSTGLSEGFLDNNVSFGVLGNIQAVDLPYSMNTIQSSTAENLQKDTFNSVLKLIPSVQNQQRFGSEVGRLQTRGMQSGTTASVLWDGFAVFGITSIPMSAFENVQVLNGPTGIWGNAGESSGKFNFILKRPTEETEASAKLTYSEKDYFGESADVSGKLNDRVSVRGVFEYGEGEGWVDGSDKQRKLASIAADIAITDNLKLETNVLYYQYYEQNSVSTFSMPLVNGTSKYTLPSAFNAADSKYSADNNSGNFLRTRMYSSKLKYDIADNWQAEVGIMNSLADRLRYRTVDTFNSNSGTYTQAGSQMAWQHAEFTSEKAQIQTQQEFFGIKNDIAFGANRNITSDWTGNSDSQPNGSRMESVLASDYTSWTDHWATLLTIGHDNIANTDSSTGKASGYNYGGSLIYKPIKNLSFYGTYADGIKQGATGTDSSGETIRLDPYRSKEYEIGAKTKIDTVDVSLAVFQMTRPIAYLSNGTYAYHGEQRNRGVELMVGGEVIHDISFYGGIAYLDTEYRDAQYAAANGKQTFWLNTSYL